ncbi:MAG: iron ABC transporter permease [Bacteroidales bacterium]|nr:iron ABC transporter permease [Bacteroidales bacterium]OJX83840.1 MAG: iron ABC transporter [Paludibacter sp. 47-17]
MISKQRYWLFIPAVLALLIFFILDLMLGSIDIPFGDFLALLNGSHENTIYREILLNYRLPKAITAVIAGASLSLSGLLMQTLFRNPLADPYILGVSSGAGLGVAITLMAASFLPAVLISTGWGTVLAAVIGASAILLLVILVSFRLHNNVSLLIVGIMFGTIASSIVSILQNFANPDAIKLYVLWTFGSLSAVNWANLQVLAPVFLIGSTVAFCLHKKSDGLLLGENYARGLGIDIQTTRILMVLSTGLLAGSVTAFTGPIAFVGVAIPHIARGLFKTSAHKILMPASFLLGGILILICDIISQIPEYTLPINTISALFGAPVIIWIILKRT